MTREKSNSEKNIGDILKSLDTGKLSIIHRLSPIKSDTNISFLSHYLIPYFFIVLITFGIMLLLACLTKVSLISSNPCILIPFFYDFNNMCMFLLTLPLAVIFLITEPKIVPSGIAKIHERGVLFITQENAKLVAERWNEKFGYFNITGQLIGIIVGFAVFYFNLSNLTQEQAGSWQAPNNTLNVAGSYWLVCLILLYFVISIYVARSIGIICFLRDLVSRSKINIIPFYPDGCGGLNPVGVIGLRNQYLLAVAGINTIALLSLMFFVTPSNLLITLTIAAVILYIIAGPLCFFGPLIPFRTAMKEDKERLIEKIGSKIKLEFKRIENLFDTSVITKEDEDEFARLRSFGQMVENLPVWPFDIATRKKIFVSYILPLIPMLGSIILQIIGWE